jgi:hypothetical protein
MVEESVEDMSLGGLVAMLSQVGRVEFEAYVLGGVYSPEDLGLTPLSRVGSESRYAWVRKIIR